MPGSHSRSRRNFLIGGALAVAALASAVVLGLRLTGNESVVLAPESTYTEGLAGTWERINPLYGSLNQVDEDIASLVFSGLVRIGPDGTVEPDLAELPEVGDGGRTYTFRLRENLEWHDGVALTARDVAFTITQLKDAGFQGDRALGEAWAGIEVDTPDTRTVVVRLPQPSAPFLARHATVGILPEHLLRGVTAEALFDAPFNQAPVGSGPYRLERVDSSEAVLVAYDRYHLGRPAIDRFRFRFFADYPSALRAAESGAIDGLLLREPLGEGQATAIEQLDGVDRVDLQRSFYLVLYLNNDQAAFFADERVRRAISLGLDRETIATRAFPEGGAAPSSSAVAPGNWAYASEYDQTTPDNAEARRLLEEAGWNAHPTTGILVREGQEFRFTIRTDNDPTRMAIADEVRAELEPLGIRATVISTTFAVLRRDFLQERRYDAAVTGWDQGPDPDPYFGWHSSQTGTAGLNFANFSNLVVDELIARARTTDDIDVRKDLYTQFQEKWEELAPGIVLAYPRYTYIHRSSLDGFVPGVLSTGSQRFYDVHKWRN
ncbi:MAG: peptide ABC transporter substrate-binding protein [Dehalococcoidia bacterium]|nr:peptide ABC transporter substrate-binding protein [Dehalococcoidia bacterium]